MIFKKIGWILLSALLVLFSLSFLAVLAVASFIHKRRKPDYMLTIDEQIDKINKEVALELCWAESYEECDEIIESGKRKIEALTIEAKAAVKDVFTDVVIEDQWVLGGPETRSI